jgi:hypothetical protein
VTGFDLTIGQQGLLARMPGAQSGSAMLIWDGVDTRHWHSLSVR